MKLPVLVHMYRTGDRVEMHAFILRNWRLVKIATIKAQRNLFFNLRKRPQKYSLLDPLWGFSTASLGKPYREPRR